MATYLPHQLYQVPLAERQPDPAQPRKYMDPAALAEMTASVGQVGISEPVVCRQDAATGLCYVVAGERRCAAARKARLPAVPKHLLVEIARKKQDRARLIESLNTRKDTLEPAITRAAGEEARPA